MTTSYCIVCKRDTPVTGGKISMAKNGRQMMKGKCSFCKRTKCMFVKGNGKSNKKTSKGESDSDSDEFSSDSDYE